MKIDKEYWDSKKRYYQFYISINKWSFMFAICIRNWDFESHIGLMHHNKILEEILKDEN
ncbi:hypothetical protein ES702_03922 [subsurface metagenome]